MRGIPPTRETDASSHVQRVAEDLLALARGGDGEAFRELVDPHRRELQVHCYRILGSVQDAEDLLQETLRDEIADHTPGPEARYEIRESVSLGGAGLTMAMPAAQKAVVGAVQPREIGQASGAFMMLRIFGGVFGVAVAVAVFASAGGYTSAEEFRAGFAAAMGAVTAFAFIGMLVALGIPGERPAAVAAPPQATSVVHQGESA
jgi:hypothetical protein